MRGWEIGTEYFVEEVKVLEQNPHELCLNIILQAISMVTKRLVEWLYFYIVSVS